jgi:hypothetical protein
MFFALPPPKRNTDQRVLNVQFVIVMNSQFPKSAHASSCESTVQFLIATNLELTK